MATKAVVRSRQITLRIEAIEQQSRQPRFDGRDRQKQKKDPHNKESGSERAKYNGTAANYTPFPLAVHRHQQSHSPPIDRNRRAQRLRLRLLLLLLRRVSAQCVFDSFPAIIAAASVVVVRIRREASSWSAFAFKLRLLRLLLMLELRLRLIQVRMVRMLLIVLRQMRRHVRMQRLLLRWREMNRVQLLLPLLRGFRLQHMRLLRKVLLRCAGKRGVLLLLLLAVNRISSAGPGAERRRQNERHVKRRTRNTR